MILCECGEFIDECTFKDYIETTAGPSTPTIGHGKCGLLLNFVDGKMPKRYSSKIELKVIAGRFADKNGLDYEVKEKFLLEVDRLKSVGKYSDMNILMWAMKSFDLDNKQPSRY
jgi:hypothetical protein